MSDTKQPEQKPSRRKFLAAAVTGSVGAAAAGFPMIAKAQAGPINMRWQSTWPAKDIFHEYALDFAKKVNDMTGGDLKIEVLPAGSVVPAFGLLEAVSKGTLDGGHGVLGYHRSPEMTMIAYPPAPFPRKGGAAVRWLRHLRGIGFSLPWGGPAGG